MRNGSAAIIYFTNTEKFGSSTAASQYLLQMASFLGMPVIAWNADNSGLEKVKRQLSFQYIHKKGFEQLKAEGKCQSRFRAR